MQTAAHPAGQLREVAKRGLASPWACREEARSVCVRSFLHVFAAVPESALRMQGLVVIDPDCFATLAIIPTHAGTCHYFQ